jgi:hypothetical protein
MIKFQYSQKRKKEGEGEREYKQKRHKSNAIVHYKAMLTSFIISIVNIL